MNAATATLVLSAFIVTRACGGKTAQVGQAPCAGIASDSARAACLALDTLNRGYQLPSRVLTIERLADTFRVRTVPAGSSTLDGMGLVTVAPGGTIASIVIGDSL